MNRVAALAIAGLICVGASGPLQAGDPAKLTIGELYQQKAELSGKQVQLQGKVVKVNNEIMKRNFLHIQDGSGDAANGTNDLTLTSQDTAAIGDEVVVVGTVTLNQDFGYGYSYPVLIEGATISKAK